MENNQMQINEEPKEYWGWYELGFCGCFSEELPDLLVDTLTRLYIAAFAEDEDDKETYVPYESLSADAMLLHELIRHVLDANKLTTHGGSVRGSWLEDKGIAFCEKMFFRTEEED